MRITGYRPRTLGRAATAVLLALPLAAGALSAAAASGSAASAGAVTTYTGVLNGAGYRVEVPGRWNGTLILWSHGDYESGYVPTLDQINLAGQPTTAQWLLGRGYALAASNYRTPVGFVVQQALTDQIALLNWYDKKVGRPRQTISAGNSMGGLIAVLLAERHPGHFSGVLSECGAVAGGPELFNSTLDLQFALKTLLAPDSGLELVHITNPAADNAIVTKTIQAAVTTPAGRARLALANALADVPGWYRAALPPPATVDDQIIQQAQFDQIAIEPLTGPTGRAALEAQAGGNPSTNIGVNYRHQLAHSDQLRVVQQAYREAGLSLNADLQRLNAAPRARADANAASWLNRYGIPAGTTSMPVLTMHGTSDGAVGAEAEHWYAAQVRRNGDPANLRQIFVRRGGHCSFTASEEVVALSSLQARLDTGRWPVLKPAGLNAEALSLGSAYQQVIDWVSGPTTVNPAFVTYHPHKVLRPSHYTRPGGVRQPQAR
jgi:pimeloyl-ACP methyl ester carboxylesterase